MPALRGRARRAWLRRWCEASAARRVADEAAREADDSNRVCEERGVCYWECDQVAIWASMAERTHGAQAGGDRKSVRGKSTSGDAPKAGGSAASWA